MHLEQTLSLFTVTYKIPIDSSGAGITTFILQSFFNLPLINLILISLSRLPHSFSITASFSSFSLEGFGNFANAAALSPIHTFWSLLTTFLSCLLSSAFYQARHSAQPGQEDTGLMNIGTRSSTSMPAFPGWSCWPLLALQLVFKPVQPNQV